MNIILGQLHSATLFYGMNWIRILVNNKRIDTKDKSKKDRVPGCIVLTFFGCSWGVWLLEGCIGFFRLVGLTWVCSNVNENGRKWQWKNDIDIHQPLPMMHHHHQWQNHIVYEHFVILTGSRILIVLNLFELGSELSKWHYQNEVNEWGESLKNEGCWAIIDIFFCRESSNNGGIWGTERKRKEQRVADGKVEILERVIGKVPSVLVLLFSKLQWNFF